jgi:hypothetical protein
VSGIALESVIIFYILGHELFLLILESIQFLSQLIETDADLCCQNTCGEAQDCDLNGCDGAFDGEAQYPQ